MSENANKETTEEQYQEELADNELDNLSGGELTVESEDSSGTILTRTPLKTFVCPSD